MFSVFQAMCAILCNLPTQYQNSTVVFMPVALPNLKLPLGIQTSRKIQNVLL